MVPRSLVWRIYAYALGLLVLLFASVLVIGRLVAFSGYEGPDSHGVSVPQRFADDLALRLEVALEDGTITPAEHAQIERFYPERMYRVEPWVVGRFPPLLASDKEVTEGGPIHDVYWVRLDVKGKPAGAVRVDFARWQASFFGGRHGFIIGVWLLVVALMTIPPLYLWVIRPLRRMVAVAQRLGEGDLATPVAVDRPDEFGDLERAFEAMRQRIGAMLEARERLLRDISHELRGPLSRMSVALPLLRLELPESRYLDTLERELAAMDALIGEVLALARGRSPQALALEDLDLADVARELVAERQLLARQRGIQLTCELSAAPVRGDRRLLARAVGNLLDNALKFARTRIRIETAVEGGKAWARVVDDGPGVAPEHLPRLFEPFYRPDTSRSRETGGTGLGLAIVKAIAEAHGGEAGLSFEAGTVAWLRLPAG